jgi:hypothetical protein
MPGVPKAYHAIAASFVHETEGQLILNGSYDIGFSVDLALKDLGFIASLAEEGGVALDADRQAARGLAGNRPPLPRLSGPAGLARAPAPRQRHTVILLPEHEAGPIQWQRERDQRPHSPPLIH